MIEALLLLEVPFAEFTTDAEAVVAAGRVEDEAPFVVSNTVGAVVVELPVVDNDWVLLEEAEDVDAVDAPVTGR